MRLSNSIISAAVALLPAAVQAAVSGIDVSDYQESVDFAAVKANGVEFVYIKATEGTSTSFALLLLLLLPILTPFRSFRRVLFRIQISSSHRRWSHSWGIPFRQLYWFWRRRSRPFLGKWGWMDWRWDYATWCA